jgi:hypothetical protein
MPVWFALLSSWLVAWYVPAPWRFRIFSAAIVIFLGAGAL